jgi:hypothetical protein
LLTERTAAALLQQMVSAINDHDLPSLVSCFHSDYISHQPVHPERSFQGQQRVVENWGWVFNRFDDFEAEVLDFAFRDCTIWSEWVWRGSDAEGENIEVRGIMILTIEDDLIRFGRLYMEPVRTV